MTLGGDAVKGDIIPPTATMDREDMGSDRALLQVHIQPGARRDQVTGMVEGVLHVRVAAPPTQNRANHALIALLAQALRVPRLRIAILRGHRSRQKVVEIAGLGTQEVRRRLEASTR